MQTMVQKLKILDSTLRDGTQAAGISFSVQDKINIVRALDRFGVDYIEAGNPGSNPKDLAFFEKIRSVPLHHAKLCAFGSTRRFGVSPDEDTNLQSLLDADTPAVVIFGKAWDLHVTEILRIDLDANLSIIRDTVRYLAEKDKEVIFDAEHFFDGYKANPEYALRALRAAAEGGASCLCLCDTNGGCMPWEISEIIQKVVETFSFLSIGIHCHNDTGVAVANTLNAVRAGACHIQGTFTGFGERCGNANLSAIIPDLILKCGADISCDLEKLRNTAVKISDISNLRLPAGSPYVGANAFTHKAGMHIDAVQKLPRSFEHVPPETVGNKRRFLTSEVSGRGTVLPMIQKFLPETKKNSESTGKLVEVLKEKELEGYQYEAAEASFELLTKKTLGLYKSSFDVVFFKVSDDKPYPNGSMPSSAIVEVKVGDKEKIAGAVGNGPVNALDRAMRDALVSFYPQTEKMRLTDYKVRVISSGSTTDSVIRVLIDSTDGKDVWTTVGVSTDIIEASFQALTDSYEYLLSEIYYEKERNEGRWE